jgi:hypothetical protein
MDKSYRRELKRQAKMNIVELARHYIEPEAMRLKTTGKVPGDFRIRQALVLLPVGQEPVVRFNESITWQMQMDTSAFRPEQTVYLHDMRKVTGVGFPALNGQKVAYIFLYFTGVGAKYSLLFDFSPNSLPQENIPEYGHRGDGTLTSYYNLFFSEMALNHVPSDKLKALCEKGFFVAPVIMPYPFTVLCNPGRTVEEFVTALLCHFTDKRLDDLVAKWSNLSAWNERAAVFSEAVANMKDKRYVSVVSLLVPQLEGVLRDAVLQLCNDDSYMNSVKACEVLRSEINARDLPGIAHRFLSSFTEFFNDECGLFLSFKRWTDDLSQGFLSRHAISHGKNVPDMYTRENCIRLFMILSTIHEIASALHGAQSSLCTNSIV